MSQMAWKSSEHAFSQGKGNIQVKAAKKKVTSRNGREKIWVKREYSFWLLLKREVFMTTRKEGKGSQVLSVVLFVLFLIALVVFLKGFGWCVGAVCDVGVETVLPGSG